MYTSIEIIPKQGGWLVIAHTKEIRVEIVFTEFEHLSEFIKTNLPAKQRSN